MAQTSPIDLKIIAFNVPIQSHPIPSGNMSLISSSPSINKYSAPFLEIWYSQVNNDDEMIIRSNLEIGVATFELSSLSRSMKIYLEEDVKLSDVLGYLLGPVMGCILKIFSKTCLHASAINIYGNAILLIGDKGVGKSTLTSAFAALGFPILSDDVAVIEREQDAVFIQPGYPGIRIWGNIMNRFFPDSNITFSRVLADLDKFFIPLSINETAEKWRFQNKAIPLQRMYYLNTRNDLNILNIEPVTQKEGFRLLLSNTYANFVYNNNILKQNFIDNSFLSSTIPIKKLNQPNDIRYIYDCCELIISDN